MYFYTKVITNKIERPYDCVKLQYTVQHRTLLIIPPRPPGNRRSSGVVYWRGLQSNMSSSAGTPSGLDVFPFFIPCLAYKISNFSGSGYNSWRICNIRFQAAAHSTSVKWKIASRILFIFPLVYVITVSEINNWFWWDHL